MNPPTSRKTHRPHRVLAVADWSLDPRTVTDAIAAHALEHPAHYALLVTAGLHGLDWAGEPSSSRPCAEQQLMDLKRQLGVLGLPVEMARIGDPEAGPAISDAVYDWPADEIVIFERNRRLRFPHPLNLLHRVERATGLPVSRIRVPGRAEPRRRLRTTPLCTPPTAGLASR